MFSMIKPTQGFATMSLYLIVLFFSAFSIFCPELHGMRTACLQEVLVRNPDGTTSTVAQGIDFENAILRKGRLASIDPKLKEEVLKNPSDRVSRALFLLKQNWNRHDSRPQRLLISGSEGSGRKTLAQALVSEFNLPCYVYDARDIITEYQNSGPQNILRIFRRAEQHGEKCAIIINNFDVLVESYNDEKSSDCSAVAVGNMLDDVKNEKVLLIATMGPVSNFPQKISQHFLCRYIDMLLPDLSRRESSIAYHLKKISEEDDSVKFDASVSPQKIAQQTEGYSHLNLQNLCATVSFNAFKNKKTTISMEDFYQEFEKRSWTFKYKRNFLRALPYAALAGIAAIAGWFTYKGLNKISPP